MEQERRQDVSQMSMIQIPQGNIYQPWNKSFPVYVDRLDTSVVSFVLSFISTERIKSLPREAMLNCRDYPATVNELYSTILQLIDSDG
jgi:hypothetical protein